MSAYVAVRQAGPHHDQPGSWIRLDQHPYTIWKPRPTVREVADLISSKISGDRITAGVLEITAGVLEIATNEVVWTNDGRTHVEPRTHAVTGEQLGLAI